MPKSSKHRSHRHSKHSSKDYSDSEEDVVKIKDRSARDDSSSRVRHDSASREKRRMSSKDGGRDLSGHGNGEPLETYVSSKRRKEKSDVADRWSGGEDESEDGDRNMEKELHKGDNLKVESRSRESGGKGESLKIESESKSKNYESRDVTGEKEERLSNLVVKWEEYKIKGESMRKSERDFSTRKEGKESKGKDLRLEEEKNGICESKRDYVDVKLGDVDLGKKYGCTSLGFEEKQGKRARENTEQTMPDDSLNSHSGKHPAKRSRRRREASSDRDKYYDDSKSEEKRLSSSGDHAKDVKYRDNKQINGGYVDKYQEYYYKEERRKDGKNRGEAYKEKYYDHKHRDDGEKDFKRRNVRHYEDVEKDNKCKDEKYHDDRERDSRRKADKYREGIQRDTGRDDKYHEDGDRDSRRKEDRYYEDEEELKHGDEKYQDDGEKGHRRRDYGYRDDCDVDYKQREEKYRKDTERDIRHDKQIDDFDKEKRHKDARDKEKYISRDCFSDKSDQKCSREDGYAGSHPSRKSTTYDDGPTHDDLTVRHRDDSRSRASKDQRSDAERRSANHARVEPGAERVRSTARTVEVELSSSYIRKRDSPNFSSHTSKDNYRSLNQDESEHRDYNYDNRVRYNVTSSRDFGGGSEKMSSSRSLEKLSRKDDGFNGELSTERHLKSDICSSPLQLDVKRSVGDEELTQRSGGGSREVKEYFSKNGSGKRELGINIPLSGNELSQVDADTPPITSPFMRNCHLSGGSMSSLPPAPFRTGVDGPLLPVSAEDEARGRSHIRHRRIGDPHVGRFQGNTCRGIPSWPSPVANGFLPFPHTPPVAFPSVMQPFPGPPLFGVRPSLELNSPAPYHMPDANRFTGPGYPVGWRGQVHDSFATLNSVFGEGSHSFKRPDWDHLRHLPSSHSLETGGDLLKGPHGTLSSERPTSEKENRSCGSADEVSAGKHAQSARGEPAQADSTEARLPKDVEMNDAALSDLVETSDVPKTSKKDEMPFFQVYLSKLYISVDLAEPELFNKCTGLIDGDTNVLSDVDDSKILYVEDAIGSKMMPHKLLSYGLFAPIDDSLFKKSISLYNRHKESSFPEDGNASLLAKVLVDSHKGEVAKNEELCPTSDSNQDVRDVPLNNFQNVEEHAETEQTKIDVMASDRVEDLEEPVSVETTLEEKPLDADDNGECLDATPLPLFVESASNNEDLKLLSNTKCGTSLVVCDVSSFEAVMPDDESVNLSRIHHSPESTH